MLQKGEMSDEQDAIRSRLPALPSFSSTTCTWGDTLELAMAARRRPPTRRIRSRESIDHAVGILMAHGGRTAKDAFQILVRASQRENRNCGILPTRSCSTPLNEAISQQNRPTEDAVGEDLGQLP